MPHRADTRKLFAPTVALLLSAQLAISQVSPPVQTVKPAKSIDDIRTAPIVLTPQCEDARTRTERLLVELASTVSPAIRTSIEQSAAKPGPGVGSAKAFGDAAAAYMITGNNSVAAWAGLKALNAEWNNDTVAAAGVYLLHLGKSEDAMQLLTCAYSSGSRTPYLLEALAVAHQTKGSVADARRFISEAARADPNDVMIETEASFINTGAPPPNRPPQREADPLEDALRELQEHIDRASNVIKTQADLIDRSIPDAKAREYAQISLDYFSKLVPMIRDQARTMGSLPATSRQVMLNTLLGLCVSNYAQVTDTMLSFPDTTQTNGSPLLFWSDVLSIDPPNLHREQEGGWKESIRWSMHGLGPALSQPAQTSYFKDKEAGSQDHTVRERACGGNSACRVRENARWCGVRKELFQRWEEASRQRHNAAARAFDRTALKRIIAAENEYLQLRDYAVRQLKKMKFVAMPGMSMEQMTIDGINASIKPVYDRHLAGAADISSGNVTFLRDRATWFAGERQGLDDTLKIEAEEIQRECEPAMRAFLELLAQEEWQAYLDHLKDRMMWSIQPKTESSFPCEGNIGPLTIEADLNKPGEGKMDLKWKGKTFSGGGSVIFGSGGTSVGVGGSAKTSGVTLSASGDSSGSAGIGGGGGYGPFQGKARVTYTSKRSPWNNTEYLGIKIKGSAGLGLSTRQGQLGVKCFPASGSVTIYPRAFYEDAVKYLSTPSSPPGRTR